MGDSDQQAEAQARAAAIGLVLPADCVAGVAANLAMLAEHAARLETVATDDAP